MRYPGPTHGEQVLRLAAFTVALLIFTAGATSLVKKSSSPAFRPSPAPSPSGAGLAELATTVVQLLDGQTGQSVVRQALTLSAPSDCQAPSSCPPDSPPITVTVQTDDEGKVPIEQALLKKQPKLTVAGYKTDTYFSFLSGEVNLLTLHNPPAGKKAVYDISREEVPIVLTRQ